MVNMLKLPAVFITKPISNLQNLEKLFDDNN